GGSTTKLSKRTTVSVLAQAPTWPETGVGRSASRNLKPSSEPDTCVPPFETVTDTSCQRAIAAGTFSASLSTDGWPWTHWYSFMLVTSVSIRMALLFSVVLFMYTIQCVR